MTRLTLSVVLLLALPALAEDLPLTEVPEALREEVGQVSGDPTVVARIPPRGVTCREATFSWLLARLPLASKAVRALELGDYAIEELENGELRIDDKEGARADCVRAIDDPGRLLMIARGLLDVAILPRIHGTGVIQLRWEVDPDDSSRLRCRGKVWFRLRSRWLHLATSPFRRTLAKVLESKLADLIGRAIGVAEAVERDPAGVMRALQQGGQATTAELSSFRERFLLH